MKYMKLGTKADTFYTEQATRTVHSDVPTDITIQINNTKFVLHKFPLVQKSGLLQRLCTTSTSSSITTTSTSSTIILHDFPGDEQSFELCAKYCYNISITLSAHNFIPAYSAASFLNMSDSVSSTNLIAKLNTFFLSFILPNWKDSILTLSSTTRLSPPFSDQFIIRPLLDSILSKILSPTSKVTWSFTYSRNTSKTSVPKDWWTEDIADLAFAHFRTIILSILQSKSLPPALVGEALHVYTVKNLQDRALSGKEKRVLEGVVSLIPNDVGAVSGGFLMKLLKIAVSVGASGNVVEELVRRVGKQLDEVMMAELEDGVLGVVEAIVESFFREGCFVERRERLVKVVKLFDEYLMVVARKEEELGVEKFMDLVELVPRMVREEHDGLYRAIDTFLEVHQEMSKADRRRLCQMIDCGKLSREVRTEAITNDRLPLRMLVQLLFVEQERGNRDSRNLGNMIAQPSNEAEAAHTRENHAQ